MLLLLFRTVPADQLLGALLAYRIIYYLVPFAVALCAAGRARALGASRAHGARRRSSRRTWLSAVTPQASAIAVFGAGAVLLFSGATPGLGNRLELLRRFVPLPILELSHLLGSAVGVGLLVLAHGLYRRLDAAWYLTMWLLCAGVLLSLLKGFDYEEADRAGRRRVAAGVGARAFSPPRLAHRAALLALLGRRGAAGARCRRRGWCCSPIGTCPTARSCGGSSPFDRPAPRSLRALLLAAMIAAAYALWRLLRPSKPAMLAAERRGSRARGAC